MLSREYAGNASDVCVCVRKRSVVSLSVRRVDQNGGPELCRANCQSHFYFRILREIRACSLTFRFNVCSSWGGNRPDPTTSPRGGYINAGGTPNPGSLPTASDASASSALPGAATREAKPRRERSLSAFPQTILFLDRFFGIVFGSDEIQMLIDFSKPEHPPKILLSLLSFRIFQLPFRSLSNETLNYQRYV